MEKKIPPLASKQLEPLLVSISDIHPHPDNYKSHPPEQLRSLKASLKTFSWTTPIKANLEGVIIAGHGMYQAALEEGYTHVPVEFCALDKQLSKAYLVADNETARKAVTEDDKLSELLKGIEEIPDFDIEAVGFSLEDVNSLIDGEPKEVVEDDFNHDVEVETRCKEGDLWALGSHRLLCGDSTKKEDIETLIHGQHPDFIFTDPPYGVGFNYSAHDDEGGENYNIFIHSMWEIIKSFNCPIVLTPGNVNLNLWIRMDDFKTACWVKKNAMSPSSISHLNIFEIILLYNVKNRRNTDLLEYPVKMQSGVCDHPCPKLLDVVCDCITTWGDGSKTLFEPFGGSGTTLIACEQLDRICFAMELDPHYCDVIISRWEQFTGQTAKKLN